MQLLRQKCVSHLLMAIDKKNNRHTISPQTHIVFIMPRSKKGLGRCHKNGTGNNQGRRQTTPRDNWCFNCNACHSKSNELSLLVISISLTLNSSVINPPQVSLFKDQKFVTNFNSWYINRNRNAVVAPKIGSHLMMAIDK